MNLSNIFKTVKSLKIQDFDKHGKAKKNKHYFKLNFPEVVALKISRSSDLKHF
jgi:hypothetical protein